MFKQNRKIKFESVSQHFGTMLNLFCSIYTSCVRLGLNNLCVSTCKYKFFVGTIFAILFSIVATSNATAQTAHIVQTRCLLTLGNVNTNLVVSPGDTIAVTFIAYTNERGPETEQDGCGWYQLPNTPSPLTIRTTNPSRFSADGASGVNAQQILIQRGQNVTVTFTVESAPVSALGIASGRRWIRESINNQTGSFIDARMNPNAPPTITGAPTTVSVTEDRPSNVDLSGATFVDADNDNLTVTLNITSGTFAVPAGGVAGVTATRVSLTQITLVGFASAINSYLDTASNIQYATALNASGNGVATLTISATDGIASLVSNPTVQINSANTPDVISVSSGTSDGYYRAGASVSVVVSFDEAVTVTGTPQLTLETGSNDRVAIYQSGSGTADLAFGYTVQAGDTSADLDYISTTALALNGGAISDNDANDADLTLPAPGAFGSLGASSAIVIDTTAPVVSDANIAFSGASGVGGVFKVGDTVTASWQEISGDGDINLSSSLGFVGVDFSAFGGGATVLASRSGTTWSASYLLANTSTTGANLNVSVTATDAAGNTTTTADTTNATVDVTPPVVTMGNISLSGATGTGGAFRIGDTVTATWNNTATGDNNADISSTTIDFAEFGGAAAVAASNSSEIWTASHTLVSGSIDGTGRKVVVTALDTSGNSTLGNGASIAVVDIIAPQVTPAAITVSGATGNPNNTVFKIGDTVAVDWNNGALGENNADTITGVAVDFAAFGGPLAATATETSGVWRATYQIPAGVLVANNLPVSIIVTDNAANTTPQSVNGLFAVDSVQPAANSAVTLEDASNSGSLADSLTNILRPGITGSAEAQSTVTVFVGGQQAGTAEADANGDWRYVFTVDLSAGDNSITTTATNSVGNTSDPSTALIVSIDTIAPARPMDISLNSVSDTGVVGDLLTNDTSPVLNGTAEAGAMVEVYVGGISVGTTLTDAGGNWSFMVPVGGLVEGANVITATATDAANNTSLLSAVLTVTLDTIIPSIAISDPLMGDNLFNAAEASAVTISGTTTDINDGQTVSLSVSDGAISLPFSTTVTTNVWTINVDLTSLSDGPLTVTADVIDVAGNAAPQATRTMTKDIDIPSVTVSGPTEIVTGAFDVIIVFTKAVFGLELAEISVTEGKALSLTGSGTTFIATVEPVLGKTVTVYVLGNVVTDAAGNPNTASNVYEVQAGSPASEFDRYESEIRQVIVAEAVRSLRNTISSNQRLVRAARERFIRESDASKICNSELGPVSVDKCGSDHAGSNNVAFDVDGGFSVNGFTLSTIGTFFQQKGNDEGTRRRLFFGDFDVQHDGETGSSTATLSGKIAWEQMVSEKTMLGYFIGGELARSNIAGAFEGDQNRLGVNVGGYAVHELADKVYLDGFLSFGAGRNNLHMANKVLALESDYTTRSATLGAALSGVIEQDGFEIWPELSFSYGRTWIGEVGFTGSAYGLVDNTLSLDAGAVTLANLMFRPEFRVPLDGLAAGDSFNLFTFAPRLICEQIKTTTTLNDCGGGVEFGITIRSADALSNVTARIMSDRLGERANSSLQLNFDHRF